MEHPPSSAKAKRQPSSAPRPRSSSTSASVSASARYGPEDFPGCESFHLPAGEVERYEGRLEFWDGRTQTAWKAREPTTIYHERPSRMLTRIATRFEMIRGSGIECFGSADLLHRDAAGRKRWLMQADEVLYLHPKQARPSGPAIDVDAGPLPDVVLEVDHTTDVRRRKLSIYRESGFPEIWVLVPPQSPVRWPGLTIHVRRAGGYGEAAESAAFPGWHAEELFRALTEESWTEPTLRALERVALAMGAREGTRPEDDPHSRSLIRRGAAEGRDEGRAEGRREERAEMVRAALRARGIEVTPKLTEDPALGRDLSAAALMEAAQACTDEADFLRRVRVAARQVRVRAGP